MNLIAILMLTNKYIQLRSNLPLIPLVPTEGLIRLFPPHLQ